MDKGNVEAKKKGPELMIKLSGQPSRLRRDTPFICNIRFKNDLPEVPCDPKMLLPPLVPQELAAFGLTSLERDMKRDMLFEPDLGIPISMLDIERYAIPYATPAERPPLDPKDEALLKDDEAGGGPQRARLRGSAGELSWLMRTKYITNEGAEQARKVAAREERARRAAEAGLVQEGAEGAIEAIERSFEAAQHVPVHPANPSLEPVEILPVLPDEALEGRTYVLALFDNDPTADLDRLQRLPPEERQLLAQTAQLKSFAQQRPDGKIDRFVAYLVPHKLREVPELAEGSGAIPAEALQTEYEWVREYDQQVKYDAKDATFLFRFVPDGSHVAYHDLNTKLQLKKRKRQQFSDEGEEFVPPEEVVLRLPGNDNLSEEDEVAAAAAGRGAAEGGPDSTPLQQRRRLAKQQGGGQGAGEGLEDEAEEGLGAEEGGSPVVQQQQDAFRDVFGDDDDDF